MSDGEPNHSPLENTGGEQALSVTAQLERKKKGIGCEGVSPVSRRINCVAIYIDKTFEGPLWV